MEKTVKRRRITTKPLQHLNPTQQFRYIGSDDHEWNTITAKKPGIIYYSTANGYSAKNDKTDGIRVILRP